MIKLIKVESNNKGLLAIVQIDKKVRKCELGTVLYPYGRQNSAYIVNAIDIDYKMEESHCVLLVEDSGHKITYSKKIKNSK